MQEDTTIYDGSPNRGGMNSQRWRNVTYLGVNAFSSLMNSTRVNNSTEDPEDGTCTRFAFTSSWSRRHSVAKQEF